MLGDVRSDKKEGLMNKYPKLEVTPADGESRPEEVSFEYKADFQGKGRFYTDITNQAKDINDLAELDDNWIVVGYHLSAAGCREASKDHVFVYAVDVAAAEAEGRHPLEVDSTGKLPVVSILCHNLTLKDIFDNMVDAEFTLWSQRTSSMPKRLSGYADRPTQP